MDLSGKVAVVTGSAQGIGAALVERFKKAGALVAALDLADADSEGGADLGISCDVSVEDKLKLAIQEVEFALGPIEVFVSNAGVLSRQSDDVCSAPNEDWARCWSVNVMAHVYAARAVLPSMIARGSGYLVNVASAAGLLNQIGDAAYSATKHAAVSFAESLAITHARDGLNISVVCPQYVATPMIGLSQSDADNHRSLLTAEDVATCILEAMSQKKFLVSPHSEMSGFVQMRSTDHDKWIEGMADLRRRSIEKYGDAAPERFYRLV